MKHKNWLICLVFFTIAFMAFSTSTSARQCTDTDPKDLINVRGKVILPNGKVYYDTCGGSDLLQQMSCSSNGLYLGPIKKTSCSDGNICNGKEECKKGACVVGNPVVCEEDEECVPATGACIKKLPLPLSCAPGEQIGWKKLLGAGQKANYFAEKEEKIITLGVYKGNLYAGMGLEGGVYRFKDGAWSPFSDGLSPLTQVADFQEYNGFLYLAGAWPKTPKTEFEDKYKYFIGAKTSENSYFGVYTTDGNIPWTYEITDLPAIKDLYSYNGKLYIGIESGLLVYSGPDYENQVEKPSISLDWAGLDGKNIQVLYSSGNVLYAGTTDGVYKYTNNNNWDATGLAGEKVSSLHTYNDSLFAVANGGVHQYVDGEWKKLEALASELYTYKGFLYGTNGSNSISRYDGTIWVTDSSIGFDTVLNDLIELNGILYVADEETFENYSLVYQYSCIPK